MNGIRLLKKDVNFFLKPNSNVFQMLIVVVSGGQVQERIANIEYPGIPRCISINASS